MKQSTITVNVSLDENKVPQHIDWSASDSTADLKQDAKAMMLAFWDGADKSAMRIDLWTKDMMVDEMGDFFYQMLMTMADTLTRSTRQEALAEEMKTYARDFFKKFQAEMVKQNAV
mgnify:CR=1 FL=1